MATKHDEPPAYGNPPQPPQPSYFSPQQGPYSPAQGQGPYSPPQGQGPYSPPQDGGYYGGQQMGYGQQPPPGGYYQQGPYPQGPVPYHQPQQQKKGPGFFEACLAGMACCCCLDLLF